MSVGLMHGRPDNPRFSPFSFAFELSLILIRMFSNAEDQSSFICRQHDTFFLTWIWKFSLFSTFCDIYTLSKKKIDEHLYKPYAFCPRIQWTQIKLPLSFCFNIYTFINYFSKFIPQRQCMLSTSLNGFLHVFISYDRHLLYFWQGAKGYSKASTFTFPFYLHHTTISKQSWI